MGGIVMNENLDLCLILKDCPKDTKLYCTFLGDVIFQYIEEDRIIIKNSYDSWSLLKDGAFNPEGECVLFPSREQRDWSKFKRFWDKPKVEKFDINTLQPFDKILTRDKVNDNWNCAIFSHIDNSHSFYPIITVGNSYNNWCIPYNDETKHLVGTTEDCTEYYKWWEE